MVQGALSFQWIVDGREATLNVRGEIDLTTADCLAEEIQRGLATRPAILTIDLGGVDFCDSQGIGILVRAWKDAGAQGCRLSVARPSGQMVRVLNLMGLSQLLDAPDPAG